MLLSSGRVGYKSTLPPSCIFKDCFEADEQKFGYSTKHVVRFLP